MLSEVVLVVNPRSRTCSFPQLPMESQRERTLLVKRYHSLLPGSVLIFQIRFGITSTTPEGRIKTMLALVVSLSFLSLASIAQGQSTTGSGTVPAAGSGSGSASPPTTSAPLTSTPITAVPGTLAPTTNTSGANFSAPGVAVSYLIQSSYSLNGAAPNCPTLTWAECNNTLQCYYNESLSVCTNRSTMNYNSSLGGGYKQPWCYRHFPTPIIAIIYLSATFLGGFAIAGVIYNAMWYDTYSRVNDVGERQFNQNYYSTSLTNIYCCCVVVSASLMGIFSLINFLDESSCTYVFFVYIYVIIVAIPAIGIPAYYFVRWLQMMLKGQKKTTSTVDTFCVPPTQPAIENPALNQVRMF